MPRIGLPGLSGFIGERSSSSAVPGLNVITCSPERRHFTAATTVGHAARELGK